MLTSLPQPGTENTLAIFRLNSKIQNYPWGSKQELARILGRIPSGQPEAELWMGAHPSCPSPLVGVPGVSDLLQLLKRDPNRDSDGLPYLFKVLSAAEPLSLQVHPDAVQAERGFVRENELGIALGAANRNYKDPRHKPELVVALTDFFALCGFLSFERILARLKHYHLDDLLPTFRAFAKDPEEHTLSELFASLFELSRSDRERAVRRVVGRVRLDLEEKNSRAEVGSWLLKIEKQYGPDPGVLAAVLLHFVRLRPGEGLYLPPGILHTYLGGTVLEIMASSDNVLRGGLTSKHVDVPELLSTLRFRPHELALVRTKTVQDQPGANLTTFLTPEVDFQLALANIATGARYVAKGPDILLALDGVIQLESKGERLELRKGDQAFCSGAEDYAVTGSGRFAKASANRASAAISPEMLVKQPGVRIT